MVVLGVTGIGALSIFDDYLIFQQCSQSALETANSDSELKTILGEKIEQGPLYAATLGVDREGNSANCSFPVAGSLAKGNLHLRAVRYEEVQVVDAILPWTFWRAMGNQSSGSFGAYQPTTGSQAPQPP